MCTYELGLIFRSLGISVVRVNGRAFISLFSFSVSFLKFAQNGAFVLFHSQTCK